MIHSTKIIDFIKNDLGNDTSLFNETPFYQNDIELKKGNLLFDLTVEELESIAKVKEDIIHLANSFCKVNTYEGIKQIQLHKYQEEYLTAQKKYRFIVTMAARQTGKTIMEAIYCMSKILEGKKILLVNNNRDSGVEVLDKIKTIYRNLPFYMKPGVQAWNQTSVVFDNGARVIAKGSSKGPALGYTFDLVYIDEAAHIPYNSFNDVYMMAFGQMLASSDGQLIVQSTPNGRNKFWEIYNDAINGKNVFYPHRIDWWLVPGRDEAWKKAETMNLGSQELFDREYGLSFGNAPEEKKEEPEKKEDNPAKTTTGNTLELITERLARVEKMLEIQTGEGAPFFNREFILTKFMGLTPDDIQKLGLSPL